MSIVLDFDGTITVHDTIGEVAKYALGVRANEGNDLRPEWDSVVKAYVDDYKRYVDEYPVDESMRERPEQEVEFLRRAKSVELASLERIHGCRLFQGIAPESFREAGRKAVESGAVVLREGFRRFVEARLREGWRVWVVSVNWSSAFIEGALDCPGVTVIANCIRADGSIAGPSLDGVNNGEGQTLTNSGDKLAALDAILHMAPPPSGASFYFGDSITDLECLLRVGRGVVVADRPDTTLLRTLRRIGKEVPHVTGAASRDNLSWASTYDDAERYVAFKQPKA